MCLEAYAGCVVCKLRQVEYGVLRWVQGLYHVATLRLCEALDQLGLSDRSSELEVSLGAYWEVSSEEAALSKQQVQLQVSGGTWGRRGRGGRGRGAGVEGGSGAGARGRGGRGSCILGQCMLTTH